MFLKGDQFRLTKKQRTIRQNCSLFYVNAYRFFVTRYFLYNAHLLGWLLGTARIGCRGAIFFATTTSSRRGRSSTTAVGTILTTLSIFIWGR